MNDQPDSAGSDRCPSAKDMADWDRGRLTAAETERLAGHLERCPECAAASAVPTTDEAAISWSLMHSPAKVQDEPDLANALSSLFAAPEKVDPAHLPDECQLPDRHPSEAPPSYPDRVGSYALVRPLGRGAMGWVYEAEHVNLRCRMALKLLPPAAVLDTATVARFYQEMAAVGKLSHPHIVQAFDAGEADGHHYLAMELVSGCDASKLIKRLGPLTVANACELTRQLALALKHAHAHGLVHRDVKPSNVMVSHAGQVKLLDLGLAAIRAQHDGAEAAIVVAGTAEYMAPEQWIAPAAVDAKGDLYALGCTLFKLLTGATPYESSCTSSSSAAEAHRSAPIPSVRAKNHSVPAELDDLVTRLLSKQPAARPASAAEVSTALARFSQGADLRGLVSRAVTVDSEADTISPSQTWTAPRVAAPQASRGRRWLAFGAAGITTLVLAALGLYRIFDRGELVLTIVPPDAEVMVDGELRAIGEASKPAVLSLSSGQHVIEVRKPGFHAIVHPFHLRRGVREVLQMELSVEERIISASAEWLAHEEGVRQVAVSPDGRRAVSSGGTGAIRLWDLESHALLMELKAYPEIVNVLKYSADGARILIGGEDRTARIWDVNTGRELKRFVGHQGAVLGADFSHDGRLIATSSFDTTVRVWDIESTKCLWAGDAHFAWVRDICFSHDDKLLLSGGNDAVSVVWDARTGDMRRALVGQNGVVLSTQFSSDGGRALTGGYDRQAILWDVEREERMRIYVGHAESLIAKFIPDDRHIVTASADRDLRLWSIDHSECLARFVGHTNGVTEVEHVPGRNSILSASGDGTLRMWPLPIDAELPRVAATLPTTERPPAAAPVGMPTIAPWRQWRASGRPVHALAFTPDGEQMITAGEDQVARLWSVDSGDELRTFAPHSDHLLAAAISPDGAYLATGGKDQVVRVWNIETGELLQTHAGHTNWITGLSFMAGGPWLVSTSLDGSLRSWNTLLNEPLFLMRKEDLWVRSIAFSPNQGSSYALAAGHDAKATLWEIGAGADLHQFEPLKPHVIADVDYAPNARLAAAVGWSGSLEVWDVVNQQHVASLEGHRGAVYSVAFAPDSERIVTGGEDKTVRLWNLAAKAEIARLTGPNFSVRAVAMSPDGRYAAATGLDGQVYLWALENEDHGTLTNFSP